MSDSSYTPEELALFKAVLDRVCIELGVQDQAHRDTIGHRIFYKASGGERDFEALRAYAREDDAVDRFKKHQDPIQTPGQFSMIEPLTGDRCLSRR